MKIEYGRIDEDLRLWNGTIEVFAVETETVVLSENNDGSLKVAYCYYYNDGTSMPNSTIKEEFEDIVPNEKMNEEFDYWNSQSWDIIKIVE